MPPTTTKPFPQFTNWFNSLLSPTEISPFNLRKLENFPFVDWSAMQAHYVPLIDWFEGVPLRERIVDPVTGDAVEKFPIKLNPIPKTCQKHAAVLLGNTLESIREGGLPIQFVPKADLDENEAELEASEESGAGKMNVKAEMPDGAKPVADKPDADKPDDGKPDDGKPDEKKPSAIGDKPAPFGGKDVTTLVERKKKNTRSEQVVDAIKRAFEYAGGGAMFADAAVSSQYMGGCVWRVRFDALNKEYPVQVEHVDPVEFLAIPKGGNHWEFHEAWFVREINIHDAKEYGYQWNGMDERFYYLEHWTADTLEVFINEKVIKKEKNPFEVIPFIYIPHIRVRGFLGKSIITDTVKGIIKEWNLRFGDVGDAVSDDSHAILATRGVRGSLGETKLSDGRKVVTLGSKSGLSNNETDPDLFAVKTQVASEPMIKLNQMLEGQYRKETDHPAVADGEDEGSQRSAATLTVRMWPLISHVEIERINWTVGMLKLAKIILKMYSVKNLFGITEDMVDAGFTIKWSSSLPRDREALVNELAIRRKNKMTSLRHTLELLGDIEDIDRELQMIEDEDALKAARDLASLEARGAQSSFGNKGNKDGENNQEKGDKTNTHAQNQMKEEEV